METKCIGKICRALTLWAKYDFLNLACYDTVSNWQTVSRIGYNIPLYEEYKGIVIYAKWSDLFEFATSNPCSALLDYLEERDYANSQGGWGYWYYVING